MQAAMDRLTAFLERRRWIVLGAWLLIVLAAAPFAVRQTEHLTSGGFTVPGSGSDAVEWHISAADSTFVRIEVRHPEGHMAALSNPIILN